MSLPTRRLLSWCRSFSVKSYLSESDNSRLRTHVDYNDNENVVVYEGFTTSVLSLVKNYPPLPLKVRKTILREVGRGLKNIHARNWIHLGIFHSSGLVCCCPQLIVNPSF